MLSALILPVAEIDVAEILLTAILPVTDIFVDEICFVDMLLIFNVPLAADK